MNNYNITGWDIAIVLYIIIALLSIYPTIQAILQKVELHPDGNGYDKSIYFNEDNKNRLIQHYSRIYGTLGFWKNQSEKYRRFNNYALFYTISISITIPVISQQVGEGNSNIFLGIISTHMALIVGFHKGYKVEKNYQSFRLAESEFFDLRRELLDMPENFGNDEKEQIDSFIKQVRTIRQNARKAEIDNTATVSNQKNIS